MRTTVLDPVGVEIRDVSLRDPDPGTATRIPRLLAEHGVAVFRDQDLDDEEFVGFLRRFGDLFFTVGETPVPEWPDLNVVSNVGRTTPPRSVFHVDTSYIARPPAYTALRAVSIPSEGGQTVFSNQYRAYETLPAHVRADLDGRTVTHRVSGLNLGPDDETEAEHRVFRPHPLTGRVSLYLSTPQRCVAISGMSDEAAAETIEFLYAHSTADENLYRHSWTPGDVVMWDNACVLHRADHSGVVGDRVMHRGMVATYPAAA